MYQICKLQISISALCQRSLFSYFVSHLLTCLLTLTFAYKYVTMLIIFIFGGTKHYYKKHWSIKYTIAIPHTKNWKGRINYAMSKYTLTS